MSDFNWDDHPIVQDSSKSPEKGAASFSWDDHPIVQAAQSADTKPIDHAAARREEFKAIKESGDATGNAIINMFGDYLPQIKAKGGQILAGEGISNDENYVKRRDKEIADEKALAEKYPKADLAGKFIGFVAPMVATGGGSAAAEALPWVEKVPSLVSSMGKSAAFGGAIGAAQNPGDTPGVVDPLQLKDRGKNAMIGTALGGAIPIAAAGIGKAVDYAAAPIAKKATSIFLGPSDEAIAARYANPERIKSAPSIETIKDNLDDTLQGLFSAVDHAQVSRDGAHEALKTIEQNVKDTTKDAGFKFDIKGANIREQLRQAQDQLKEAFDSRTQVLAEKAQPPIELAPSVGDAIADVKAKVSKGSKDESYAILDKDPRSYNIRQSAQVLHNMADEMNIQGKETAPKSLSSSQMYAQRQPGQSIRAATGDVATTSPPITDESAAVQGKLRKFANIIENTPEKMPAPELKKMIQQIDKSGEAIYGQPGFDPRVSQAYKGVRASIDNMIKTSNPEYADKMKEVSQNIGLMNHAIDRFGDQQSAMIRLKSIGGDTAGLDRQLLAKLGDATGRDFVTPINEHMIAKAQLRDTDAIKAAIPASKQVSELQSQNRAHIRPEAWPEYEKSEINAKGLPEAKTAAQSRLAESETALAKSKDDLEPFKSLGQKSTQNAVKGLMKAPDKESIELRRTIQALSDKTGIDFAGQIEARRLAEQFSGTYMNGSRNAHIGGAVGGAIGGVFSPEHVTGAAIGYGIGNAIGGVIDKNGRQIAGRLIDAAKSGSQTKVAQLLMSTSRYAELAKRNPTAFQSVVRDIANNEGLKSSAPTAESPKKGPGKWANDGADKLIEHTDDPKLKQKIEESRGAMMKDPKARELLIQASDLKAGSKQMASILSKLKEKHLDDGEDK